MNGFYRCGRDPQRYVGESKRLVGPKACWIICDVAVTQQGLATYVSLDQPNTQQPNKIHLVSDQPKDKTRTCPLPLRSFEIAQ